MALDLGATKVAIGVWRDREALGLKRWALPDLSDGPAEQRWLLERVVETARETAWPRAVGIAAAPALDFEGHVVSWPNRPHWIGVPLRNAVSDALQAPAEAKDDGLCATLADRMALHTADLVHFVLGTGVGGGVVSRGRLLGEDGHAPELGHLVVRPDGRRCRCGRHGCLQAYASGRAIQQFGVEDAVSALALAVSNLAEIFDPKIVSFSGGALALVPDVHERVAAASNTWLRRSNPKFVLSPHGADGPLIGALELAQRLAQAGVSVTP